MDDQSCGLEPGHTVHQVIGGPAANRYRFGTAVRLALRAVVLAVCVHAELPAQVREGSRPLPLSKTAGRFTATRLSRSPAIDGREWIAVDVQTTSEDGPVPVPGHSFSLTASGCGDRGDFVRCELLFRSAQRNPVRIDREFTGWVYVTPDARYVFTEPLYALDVHAWKQYALFDALGIENYVSIEAISRDGRRLLISRTDCAYDCRDEPPPQYYQLTLPK